MSPKEQLCGPVRTHSPISVAPHTPCLGAGRGGELGEGQAALPAAPRVTQAREGGAQPELRGPPTDLYVATKSVSSSGSGFRTQEQFTACG